MRTVHLEMDCRPASGEDVCDFCSALPVHAAFLAPDRVIWAGEVAPNHVAIATSDGAWTACRECAALIVLGNARAVQERAVAALSALHPELDAAHIRSGVSMAHAAFWYGRRKP